MKIISWVLLALVVLTQWDEAVRAQSVVGALENNTTVTIRADGSCSVSNATLQTRSMVEQQLWIMERYERMSEAQGDGDASPATTAQAEEPKRFTDAELVEKLGALIKDRTDDGVTPSITASRETVRVETARAYASIQEMFAEGRNRWAGGLPIDSAVLEQETNGNLRVTLRPASTSRRKEALRAQLKAGGAKSEFRLVLPGKVFTSGLPEKRENATWLAWDGTDAASIDAALNVSGAPIVITAEAGGLTLEEPLDSKTIMRMARQEEGAWADLPAAGSGQGFLVEAQSITTSTRHVFPEGEELFKSAGDLPGLQVEAKIFAPRGRTLQAVTGVRALKAVDDKGRSVLLNAAEGSQFSISTDDSGEAVFAQFNLRFALPEPDARAIENVTGEAMAVSTGSWKEMTLGKLEEDDTREISLSEVLPGAKLVITKFDARNGQVDVQARLTGPPTIRRLYLQAELAGSKRLNGSCSEVRFIKRAEGSTRLLSINGYSFGGDNRGLWEAVVLRVRFPEDARRDRVHFTFNGLDLL